MYRELLKGPYSNPKYDGRKLKHKLEMHLNVASWIFFIKVDKAIIQAYSTAIKVKMKECPLLLRKIIMNAFHILPLQISSCYNYHIFYHLGWKYSFSISLQVTQKRQETTLRQ